MIGGLISGGILGPLWFRLVLDMYSVLRGGAAERSEKARGSRYLLNFLAWVGRRTGELWLLSLLARDSRSVAGRLPHPLCLAAVFGEKEG
jgi:hypothetical protein